jgi:hypothetical protein
LAIDLNGNAGETVKLLGALVGPTFAHSATYVGLGIRLLDSGWTEQQLASAALDAVLGPGHSNASVVSLIYQALTGFTAPQNVIANYTSLLDLHVLSPAELLVAASETQLNLDHIGFAGMAAGGVEYALN